MDSDMEKGDRAGANSMLRGLFRKKAKEALPTSEDGTVADGVSHGTIFRTSRGSLSELHLDEDSPLGVISLEDVLEELIGEEIYVS